MDKRMPKLERLQRVAPVRQAVGHAGFCASQIARRSLACGQQKVVEKPVRPFGCGAGGVAQRVGWVAVNKAANGARAHPQAQVRVVRAGVDGLQHVLCRLFGAARKHQQPAQLAGGSGKLRVQAQGALQFGNRPVNLAGARQHRAQRKVGKGVAVVVADGAQRQPGGLGNGGARVCCPTAPHLGQMGERHERQRGRI